MSVNVKSVEGAPNTVSANMSDTCVGGSTGKSAPPWRRPVRPGATGHRLFARARVERDVHTQALHAPCPHQCSAPCALAPVLDAGPLRLFGGPDRGSGQLRERGQCRGRPGHRGSANPARRQRPGGEPGGRWGPIRRLASEGQCPTARPGPHLGHERHLGADRAEAARQRRAQLRVDAAGQGHGRHRRGRHATGLCLLRLAHLGVGGRTRVQESARNDRHLRHRAEEPR